MVLACTLLPRSDAATYPPPRGVDLDLDWMLDRWEYDNGLNYRVNDAGLDKDKDGLSNLFEFVNGTSPTSKDTDSDGLPDGWEVEHGLDPLSPEGGDGPLGDPDVDGLSNQQELARGSDPRMSNYDSDGLPVAWETLYGLDPYSAAGDDGDSGDPDGDGLTNLQEYRIDTDPTVADTDGDGLSDGWEVEHVFDPAVANAAGADTDDDGLSDEWEALHGTDPREAAPDTDGDGLPDEWEMVYFGNLGAEVDEDPDGDLMSNLLEYWLGTDPVVVVASPDVDGDGLPDEWENLYGGLTLVPGSDTDGDGLTAVEEFEWGTDPLRADTDGDGLNDYLEVTVYRTSPLRVDTDGNGVTDDIEAARLGDAPLESDFDGDGLSLQGEIDNGTDPDVADTDGDGMPDGWEVSYGLDPRVFNAYADPDSDGISNIAEYRAGTSPIEGADPDMDGMPTAWEMTYGFNPAAPDGEDDADGDGLSNAEEYAQGTSPRNPDCDDDGVSDGVEARYGTRSDMPDTDGDGLPDWWEIKWAVDAPEIPVTFSAGTCVDWWALDGAKRVSGSGYAGAGDPCVWLPPVDDYARVPRLVTPEVAYPVRISMHARSAAGSIGPLRVLAITNGAMVSGILSDAYGTVGASGTGEAWDYADSRAVRISNNVVIGTGEWLEAQWKVYASAVAAAATPGTHPEGMQVLVATYAYEVEEGDTLAIVMEAVGGEGPYTYEWDTELPPSAYSAEDNVFTVSDSAVVGAYTLLVTASDSQNPPNAATSDAISIEVTPARPRYAIEIAPADNGTVIADAETAKEGTVVTITATPAPGYVVGGYSVTAADLTDIPVVDGAFEMPAQPVSVHVTFRTTPVVTIGGSYAGTVGTPLELTIAAAHAAPDDWIIELMNWLGVSIYSYAFDPETGAFSFTPAAAGEYRLEVQALEGGATVGTADATLTVTAPPVGASRRALAAPAGLVLSEVAAPSDAPGVRFVEVWNAGADWDMTESLWHLRSVTSDGFVYDARLSSPVTLEIGETITVVDDAATFSAAFPGGVDGVVLESPAAGAEGHITGYGLYSDVPDWGLYENDVAPFWINQGVCTADVPVVAQKNPAVRLAIQTWDEAWLDDITVWCDNRGATIPNADEDPDGDGLTNLQEYSYTNRLSGEYSDIPPAITGKYQGLNPYDPDTDGDGIFDGLEVTHGLDPKNPSDAPYDLDGDGISNKDEFLLGTDLADVDTDDDGLSDGREVLEYATDPLDPDTDDDGMPDGWEVSYGLDPTGVDGPILAAGTSWTYSYPYVATEADELLGYMVFKVVASGTADVDMDGEDEDDVAVEHAHTIVGFSAAPNASGYAYVRNPAQYGYEKSDFVLGSTLVFTTYLEAAWAYIGAVTSYNVVATGNGVELTPVSGDSGVLGALEDGESWKYEQAYTVVAADVERGYVTNRFDVSFDADVERDGEGDKDGDGTFDVPSAEYSVEAVAAAREPGNYVAVTSSPPRKKFFSGTDMGYLVTVTSSVTLYNPELHIVHISAGGETSLDYAKSGSDPDADGVENVDEYGLGTSPILCDTDLDGLADGDSVTINSSDEDDRYSGWAAALWFTDEAGAVPGTTNRTFHGENEYGTLARTNDTDGDGLLDGTDITTGVGLMGDDARYRYYRWSNSCVHVDVGYSESGCSGDRRIYRGELTQGTSPLVADTDADGIPDGWELQHNSGGALEVDEDFVDITGWINSGGTEYPDIYGTAAPSYALDQYDYLVTPSVDYPTQLVAYGQASVPAASCAVAYSVDGGATWNDMAAHTYSSPGSVWTVRVVSCGTWPVPNVQSLTNVMFRFTATTAGRVLYLDDVRIWGRPPDMVVPDDGGDADGDGVPNLAEYAAGSYMETVDTDGDGGLDGASIAITSTSGDPRYVDWASAGVVYEEAESPPGVFTRTFLGETDTGTSPATADTDNDGLIDLYDVTVPYGDWRYLAWRYRYAYEQPGDYRFIGELDLGTDNRDFDSDDDGAIDGETYAPPQEVWLAMLAAGVYSNRSGMAYGEYDGYYGSGAGTSPVNPDTDGDGMPDGWEIHHGLDPLSAAVGDSDSDGLDDLEEYLRGLAPDDSDTDQDSMPDGWEVLYMANPPAVPTGLDPRAYDADADADGDGVLNVQERVAGTNPVNPDTDGDTLPDGWELTYGLDPLSASGEDGSDGDNDGDSLHNAQELAAGSSPINPDTDGDSLTDGEESAVDTDPSDANSGYYDDYDGDGLINGIEFDVNVFPDGRPEPDIADTDGDGLLDGFEYYGSLDLLDATGDNGAAGDPDADGLSNLEEQANNTAPHIYDTDGDGMPDGWEVEWGLNPLIDDSQDDADEDGYSNVAEYDRGTSPRAAAKRGYAVGDTYEKLINTYMEDVQKRMDALALEYSQRTDPGDDVSCMQKDRHTSRSWVYKRNRIHDIIPQTRYYEVANWMQWVLNQYGVEYKAESTPAVGYDAAGAITGLVSSLYTSLVHRLGSTTTKVAQTYTDFSGFVPTNLPVTNYIDSGPGVDIPAFKAADVALLTTLPRFLYPKWREYVARNYRHMVWFYPRAGFPIGWQTYGYHQLWPQSLKLKLYDQFVDCSLPTERFIWPDVEDNTYANGNLSAAQLAAGYRSLEVEGWKLGSAAQYPVMQVGVAEHRLRSLWPSGKSDTNVTVLYRLRGVETVTTSTLDRIETSADFAIVGPGDPGRRALCWASPSRVCASPAGGEPADDAIPVQIGFLGGDAGTQVTFSGGGIALDATEGTAGAGPTFTRGWIVPGKTAKTASVVARRGQEVDDCTVDVYPSQVDVARAPDVWPYFKTVVDPASFITRVPASGEKSSAAVNIITVAPHGHDAWPARGGMTCTVSQLEGTIPGFTASVRRGGSASPAGAWAFTVDAGFSPGKTNWAGVVRATVAVTGLEVRTHALDFATEGGTDGTVRVPPETLMWSRAWPTFGVKLTHAIDSNVTMVIDGIITGTAFCVQPSGIRPPMAAGQGGGLVHAPVQQATTSVPFRVRISRNRATYTGPAPTLNGVKGYWVDISGVSLTSYTRLAYGADVSADMTYVPPAAFPRNLEVAFGYFDAYDTYDVADDMSYRPLTYQGYPVGYQFGVDRELDFTADPNGELARPPMRNISRAGKPIYTRVTPGNLNDRARLMHNVTESPVEFAYDKTDKVESRSDWKTGSSSQSYNKNVSGASYEVFSYGTRCSYGDQTGDGSLSVANTRDDTYTGDGWSWRSTSDISSDGSCSASDSDSGDGPGVESTDYERELQLCWTPSAGLGQEGLYEKHTVDTHEKTRHTSHAGGACGDYGWPDSDDVKHVSRVVTEESRDNYSIEGWFGNTPSLRVLEIANYWYMPAGHTMYAVDTTCGGTSEDLPLSDDGQPVLLNGTRTYPKLKHSPPQIGPGRVDTIDKQHTVVVDEGASCGYTFPVECRGVDQGWTYDWETSVEYVSTDNRRTNVYSKRINSWYGSLDRFKPFNGTSSGIIGLMKGDPLRYHNDWNVTTHYSYSKSGYSGISWDRIGAWTEYFYCIDDSSGGSGYTALDNRWEWAEGERHINRVVLLIGRWTWDQHVKDPTEAPSGIIAGREF